MTTVLSGHLLIDIEGQTLTAEDQCFLKHPRVCGVILFARNFSSSSQLKQLCEEILNIRADLIISVDQEGGRVQRFLGEGFPSLPSFKSLGALARQDLNAAQTQCRKVAVQMAQPLIACGVNVCFSPVVDCDPMVDGSVLDGRCFSDKPEEIIKLATSFIRGMSELGLAHVVKHFPGHGGVHEDTHHEAAVDHRSLETLMARDLLPYLAMKSTLQSIMLSHVIFPAVDSLPCSMSAKWVEIVKNIVGAKPIVFTDCLSMSAAKKIYKNPVERVNRVFEAGVDVALLCNDRNALRQVIHQLPNALSKSAKQRLFDWQKRALCA